MAKTGSNGNGIWKTAFLVAASVAVSMGGMNAYFGERIARVEQDVKWIKEYLSPPVSTANTKGTNNET